MAGWGRLEAVFVQFIFLKGFYMKCVKKSMTKVFMVMGLISSISSSVFAQPLTSQDVQELRRVINYIDSQKIAISNALNIALMQKDPGFFGRAIKHIGYSMGAGFVAIGTGVVLANGEKFKSEDKFRLGFILPIMVSFALSYVALFATFEYLLPESGVQVQKDALQQLIKTLDGQKQALEGILARGEYQLASN